MQDTPGGILSHLVWNLAFDQLLDDFNTGPAQTKGFVDNVAVVMWGPDVYTLIEQGQEAIHKALDFGGRKGLEFGAERTEAIIFTHKPLKTESLPHLCMGAHDLDYSDTVRCLGISLDSKPTFGPHIREKAKIAIRLVYQFRTSVGLL